MDKDKDNCQRLYRTLLKLSLQNKPATYIRELFETESCDSNLKIVRDRYQEKLSKSTLDRILLFQQNSKDMQIAQQVVFHYAYWTENTVKTVLDLKGLVWYHTIYMWQKTLLR
jgi:hypothetical protein